MGRSKNEVTIRSPDALIPLEEQEGYDEDEANSISASPSQDMRTHPWTLAGRWGTTPAALPLPRASFINPVSLLLSNVSNKHLDDAARRVFEGSGLPYSPSTPASSRSLQQRPIPLGAGQTKMSEIEADIYMAAVMPQTYAAVMSTVVEVRKRLGASWLEGLLKKKDGPRILDAGAGAVSYTHLTLPTIYSV